MVYIDILTKVFDIFSCLGFIPKQYFAFIIKMCLNTITAVTKHIWKMFILLINVIVFFPFVAWKLMIWETAIFYVCMKLNFPICSCVNCDVQTVNQMTRICLLCLYVDCRVQILFFINECKEIKNRKK